jgi:hypothetical protein
MFQKSIIGTLKADHYELSNYKIHCNLHVDFNSHPSFKNIFQKALLGFYLMEYVTQLPYITIYKHIELSLTSHPVQVYWRHQNQTNGK